MAGISRTTVPWSPYGVYYGWVVVAGALLMNLASAPMNPVTYSFFLAPMGQELGWTRSEMSFAITFRLVAAGITAPLLGQLIDRAGSRWMGVVAGCIAGASLVAISATDRLWVLYAVYAFSGAAGFGGPGGALLTTVPVGKWFVIKRGRAMAIATVGFPMGTVIAIQVAQWLIDTAGWRSAWLVFGIVLTAVVVPVSALLMRRSPEDYGLRPDGGAALPPLSATGAQSEAETEVSWTRSQAMRHPTAWLILAAQMMLGFALSGTLVHRVAFWQDLGISPALVAIGTAADPFTVVFSALLFGIVAERVPLHVLGLVGGTGFAASMLPMMFPVSGAVSLFLHNIVWGFFAGAFITTNNLIWANYFGRKAFGAIQGIVLPVSVAANGLAAPAYGYLLDIGVDPFAVWSLSFALFCVAGSLLFFARPPKLPPALPPHPPISHVEH